MTSRRPSRFVNALAAVAVSLTAVAGQCLPAHAAPVADATDPGQSGEWWLGGLGIKQAWKLTQGAGVTVGLIDSGVQADHPSLRGAVLKGTTFATAGLGSPDGWTPIDGFSHGTAMAGLIAAQGNDGGYVGVAPKAKILPVATPGAEDTTDVPVTGKEIGSAIRWAVDHGAKVINLSIGAAVEGDAVSYAQAHDVVIVAGTGNDGSDTLAGRGVSTDFGVVAVSGIDADGNAEVHADRGGPAADVTTAAGLVGGTAVSAPFSTKAFNTGEGLPVLDTTSKYSYNGAPGKSYGIAGGTSNSAAIVSGIVALIRSRYPDMNAANVVNTLLKTLIPFEHGKYTKYGWGIPNAQAAVTKQVATVCANPLGDYATQNPGIWKSILKGGTYTPTCTNSPSNSPPPSTSPPASSPTSSSSASPVASTDSGGVPSAVWVVVGVAVVLLAGLAGLYLRGRGRTPSGTG